MKISSVVLLLFLLNPLVAYSSEIMDSALKGGISGAFLVFLVYALKIISTGVKRAKEVAGSEINKISKQSITLISNLSKSKEDMIIDIDDNLYKIASSEIENNTKVEGLWLKALVISEGDTDKSKATYIRLRANQLSTQGE